MRTRSHKIIEKGLKKVIDKDKILEKIEKEKKFQRQQMKLEEYDYGYLNTMSKGQRKKLYGRMLSSMLKVKNLSEKIGIPYKDYSSYYKNKLEEVNEQILISQSRLKRIVLTEKNNYKNRR